MVQLGDRLDHVLGRRAADPLETAFGLVTVEDLLRHYPFRYVTQGQELARKDPDDGERITVVGKVSKADLVPMKARKGHMLKVVLTCDGQNVSATFFNGHKVRHNITVGSRAMFSGTVKWFRTSWSLNHPGYLMLEGDEDDLVGRPHGGGELAGMARGATDSSGAVNMSMLSLPFLPMYAATREVESWTFLRCVRQVLDQLDRVEDPLPETVRAEHALMSLDDALRVVHFPESEDDIENARYRLRFDEATALQLVLAERRHSVAVRTAPACARVADGVAAAFDEVLPFELTDGQKEVAEEIESDLSRTRPMSRLLQGEVGSGKTIVALRAMLQVVDAGLQCALLAPTEVLATQHHRSITRQLGALATAGELGAPDRATRVVLLTGSMSTAAKRAALLSIVTGDAGIVIGTHALIQSTVSFFDLGMVVVDEQHRFGVEQRDALRAKAREGVSPHLLVMTATPIPRTIAMTTLGDLDTSTLRELPRGRAPIRTSVVPAQHRPAWVERAWSRISEEVAAGRQAYVVCSRIGDEKPEDLGKDTPDTASAVDVYESLRAGALSNLRVGLLHGRLPTEEKDEVMSAFNDGDIDVLVCTTVVEVGVDVPNATVMVIVDADRFGVSQLHQLRGRIGRGGHQGLCILLTELAPGTPTYARLDAVAATTDGFELAVLDLRQRREGDVLGAAQSGTTTTLRLLSLLDHLDIITAAQTFARDVVDRDPGLVEHPGLAAMMRSAVDATRVDFLDKA
ncbi:ATP-dependent DNA helicase RecG [Rhodococcus sp. BP-332]|uniref:ATP-dependent DNA helicase RecG n=1 Tax=Rhodococcus sp. BP-332 TaxID=2739447 RepID=UPI001C9B8990|nr:ATP-dependent DNA helicase RecG [Rhodococcus sp. BP-332]MBY6675873.1 ATP-dependent DNA helicase RecG [Rhodococcus sp. BP-332]